MMNQVTGHQVTGHILWMSLLFTAAHGIPLKKPPHLVYVLIDDMGFNDFYTSTDLAAAWPHVSELAASQCINMHNFYTQPICTPSRGTLMTGRMPLRLGLQHGVINGAQDYGLPLDEATLPQKLRATGYRTYGVGACVYVCLI